MEKNHIQAQSQRWLQGCVGHGCNPQGCPTPHHLDPGPAGTSCLSWGRNTSALLMKLSLSAWFIIQSLPFAKAKRKAKQRQLHLPQGQMEPEMHL